MTTPPILSRQFSSGCAEAADEVFQVFPTRDADVEPNVHTIPIPGHEESRAVICVSGPSGPSRSSGHQQILIPCTSPHPSVVRAHSAERVPTRLYSDASPVRTLNPTPDAGLTHVRLVSPLRATIRSSQSTQCLPLVHPSPIISTLQRPLSPPPRSSLGQRNNPAAFESHTLLALPPTGARNPMNVHCATSIASCRWPNGQR